MQERDGLWCIEGRTSTGINSKLMWAVENKLVVLKTTVDCSHWFAFSSGPCPPFLTSWLFFSSSGNCSTLKIEAADSTESLIFVNHTTWGYIPEESNLYSHCCENCKSYNNRYCEICYLLQYIVFCTTRFNFWKSSSEVSINWEENYWSISD